MGLNAKADREEAQLMRDKLFHTLGAAIAKAQTSLS